MNGNNCVILNWNVRGLNGAGRKQVVRDLVSDHHANVVCLQETKLQEVNDRIIAETLGPQFVGAYAFLPAAGTRGGVIIACSVDAFLFEDVTVDQFTVSANIKCRADGRMWTLTRVYGPQDDWGKRQFMDALIAMQQHTLPAWTIMGDFNLIYRASHKSNNRINIRLINGFKGVLDQLDLKELHLNGRRFTWSSETDSPTFTKVDHIFFTKEWEFLYPTCSLQALASSMPDHCPLLVTQLPSGPKRKPFRFESFWPKLLGFLDIVQQNWAKPCGSSDKVHLLDVKLSRLSNALQRWSRSQLHPLKLGADIAAEIVLLLDRAQEERPSFSR